MRCSPDLFRSCCVALFKSSSDAMLLVSHAFRVQSTKHRSSSFVCFLLFAGCQLMEREREQSYESCRRMRALSLLLLLLLADCLWTSTTRADSTQRANNTPPSTDSSANANVSRSRLEPVSTNTGKQLASISEPSGSAARSSERLPYSSSAAPTLSSSSPPPAATACSEHKCIRQLTDEKLIEDARRLRQEQQLWASAAYALFCAASLVLCALYACVTLCRQWREPTSLVHVPLSKSELNDVHRRRCTSSTPLYCFPACSCVLVQVNSTVCTRTGRAVATRARKWLDRHVGRLIDVCWFATCGRLCCCGVAPDVSVRSSSAKSSREQLLVSVGSTAEHSKSASHASSVPPQASRECTRQSKHRPRRADAASASVEREATFAQLTRQASFLPHMWRTAGPRGRALPEAIARFLRARAPPPPPPPAAATAIARAAH